MLENKLSTLKSEDVVIVLPMLNSPSAGNEQNPTVDDIHKYPTVEFDSRRVIIEARKTEEVEKRRGTVSMNITV
eukprot:9908531-Ditylum_brightwellii.AAC.1